MKATVFSLQDIDDMVKNCDITDVLLNLIWLPKLELYCCIECDYKNSDRRVVRRHCITKCQYPDLSMPCPVCHFLFCGTRANGARANDARGINSQIKHVPPREIL